MRRRKLLSLFLSLCLCLSLLPTAVLAEDVQTEPLTEVAVTFPAPKAGENISEAMKAASGNADSGLTLYLTGPALWKQGEEPDKLDENAVYAEGNTYLLNFTFYTQKPITDETVLTCNGKPITRYADYRALTEALDAYDGTQDACLAFVMFSEEGTGDPSMKDLNWRPFHGGSEKCLCCRAFYLRPRSQDADDGRGRHGGRPPHRHRDRHGRHREADE